VWEDIGMRPGLINDFSWIIRSEADTLSATS